MGKVDELMNVTPPKFLVFLVRLLLPRICREHVLGGLYERYRSPFGYAADAAGAVPAVASPACGAVDKPTMSCSLCSSSSQMLTDNTSKVSEINLADAAQSPA